MNQPITRRNFLKSSIVSAAACSLAPRSWAQVPGANNDIRVAVVGNRIKGADHIEVFRNLPGVRVVALCEVDQEILAREAQKFKDRGETVETCQDVRKLLDNRNIDALVIATPNHWHALLAVWACQAGKDVYVEKPVSHNVREGRQMIRSFVSPSTWEI